MNASDVKTQAPGRLCLYPTSGIRVCGKPAERPLRLIVDDRHLEAAYCPKHVEFVIETLTILGMELAARTGRKRRALYLAASGAQFSMAQARAWAIDEGMAAGEGAGRVSKSVLEAYAAAH